VRSTGKDRVKLGTEGKRAMAPHQIVVFTSEAAG
jgi:hypothetical protein